MGNASVQRGLFFTFRLFSLIRHALRRATLSVGEGDLRRGLSYPLLGEGGRAIGPDGCGAGRRTDLVPPLLPQGIPCPLLLGEGAAAGLGVEGTPESQERSPMNGKRFPFA